MCRYLLLFVFLAVACTPEVVVVIYPTPETSTNIPYTPVSTSTPAPTSTFVSTSTPAPTSTFVSTSTPAPTSTPVPTSTPAPTSTPVPTSTPAPKLVMQGLVQELELVLNNGMSGIDWDCQAKITTDPDTPVVVYCDGISYDDELQFASFIIPKEIGPHLTLVRGLEKTPFGQAIVLECIIIEEPRCIRDRMTYPEATLYLIELWLTYNDYNERY